MIYLVVISDNKIIQIFDTTGFENKQLFNVMTDRPVEVLSGMRNIICKLSSKGMKFEIYSIETDINLLTHRDPNHLYESIIQNGSKIFAR